MEQSLTFRLEDKIYGDPHIALRVPEFSNYLAHYIWPGCQLINQRH